MGSQFRVRSWELLIGLGLFLVLAMILLPALARSRESARRSSCQNNLKQMGLVLRMFANESKGERFPPVSPILDNWIVDLNAIYPEYLTDLSVLMCPSSPFATPDTFHLHRNSEHPHAAAGTPHPDCVSSLFYNYTGYTILGDEQASAVFNAYLETPDSLWAQEDLKLNVPVWKDSGRIEPGGQSNIPVLWDRVLPDDRYFAHTPVGANVLHMDGHVQFVRYSYYNNSSYFPVTRLSAETFGNVVPRLSRDCYPF